MDRVGFSEDVGPSLTHALTIRHRISITADHDAPER